MIVVSVIELFTFQSNRRPKAGRGSQEPLSASIEF